MEDFLDCVVLLQCLPKIRPKVPPKTDFYSTNLKSSHLIGLLFYTSLACKKTYDRPFVATKLKFTPDFDHVFMVGGQDAVHVWKLDEMSCKANVSIIPLGKIKRTISDMVVVSFQRLLSNARFL